MDKSWLPIRKVTVGSVLGLLFTAYFYFTPADFKENFSPEAAMGLQWLLFSAAAYLVKDPRVLGELPDGDPRTPPGL